ncbi:MAG TPA: hypothetical protein VFU31_25045 [Candidatus Binatia bacterium]|nr:hypothetical protein [Candidatus Binatia bacterium]
MNETEERKLTTEDVAVGSRGKGTEGIAHPPREKNVQVGDASATEQAELSPLFSGKEEQDFRGRWKDIQTGFVDEPRRCVEQADELVAQLMQRLAESFSQQRSNLETQWEKSDEVSTEDLRLALRRYRSFFDRLLSI